MNRVSRLEWALVSAALLAAAIWVNTLGGFLPAVASGLIGFAGGWVMATRVLP